MLMWHRSPVNPAGQTHVKAAMASMHVALFWHGDDSHSLMLISQSLPVKPGAHTHS